MDKIMHEHLKLLMSEMERCREEMKEGLNLEIGQQLHLEALEERISGESPPTI